MRVLLSSLAAWSLAGSALAGAPYCPPGHSQRECDTEWAAAQAAAQQQHETNAAAFISALGTQERYKMLRTLEDTFSRLAGKPYTVITAIVLPKGSGYLFCGSGMYGDDGGVFVFDTNEGGTHSLNATKAAFGAAGCNGDPSVTLR